MDRGEFLKKGKEVEGAFITATGREAYFSDTDVDMRDHWDVGIIDKVDVKGMKKIRRNDEAPTEHLHYIELRNVHGEPGWLFGEANTIAFETKDYFVCVDRLVLSNWIKGVLVNESVSAPELYKLYSRKDRDDLMTLVTTYDLCFLSKEIIPKKKGA